MRIIKHLFTFSVHLNSRFVVVIVSCCKVVRIAMVKIGLQISATLENVEELKTCHPNYSFFLKLKCSNCGETSDKWHDVTESDKVNEDSRNPLGFNFFAKCKLCNRENTVDILEGTNGSRFPHQIAILSNQLHFCSHLHR